jgi:3-dehydroquinate dehydratase / shikimate dehydrogenase
MLFLSLKRLQEVRDPVDGVELRLDLFEHIDIDSIRDFLHRSTLPVLLTVRKIPEGVIEKLLELKPAFFDLEYERDQEFLRRVIGSYPQTKFILSYHNFQQTPTDLEEIYLSMKKIGAHSYKIAAMVHSTNDALKMLLFKKNHLDLSVVCMGEKGQFSRVLGPVVGNQIDYASLNAKEQTAPGQLSVSELIDLYRYSSLNEKTAIYGLIGDPIDKSQGVVYHNRVFKERGVNAVYVKLCVKPEELTEFIPLVTRLGIKGLSVTMPLKEKILSCIDEVEPALKQIGAVNTLLFKESKIRGANYDGEGALDAVERRSLVRGKKIVLLGAGGAARAIAFEAKKRGATVVILNRTVQRAKELAIELNCNAGSIDELPEEYDILINCTPNLMPIDPQLIKHKKVVMDVINSACQTAFLTAASLKECVLVYGSEMFLNQAAKQTAFWIE